MATKICPDCGHQVSESAMACPSCGRPTLTGLRPQTVELGFWQSPNVGAVAALIVVAVVVLFIWLAKF